MFISSLLIILGFILLIFGADFLVDGSSNIAKRFHIPEIIVGLTIVSIGTSMPELFVSITSAINGYSDIALGNVIGSNLCNLLLILGVSTLIRPVIFKRETKLFEIPLCLILTIIFTIICNTSNLINKYESIFLIFLFILFIIYTIIIGIKGKKISDTGINEKKKSKSKEALLKNLILIVLGIIGLKFGGDLAVNNAVNIAKSLNISEKIIGLTILAVGTSLPELITSVMAALKGNSDIAIGNILGSNIFNMLLIIGVSSYIKPIIFNISYNMDLCILIIATLMLSLFPLIPPKNQMSKVNGLIYLLLYFIYLTILFFE